MRKLLSAGAAVLALAGCQAKKADTYAGYIEAQTVSVDAPQAGWLTSVNVDRGSAVAPDQLLFTLDATQADAALAGAQSRAAAAQANAEDLAKGARQADIAPLQAQRAQAQSQLDLARANEARYAVLATRRIDMWNDQWQSISDRASPASAAARRTASAAKLADERPYTAPISVSPSPQITARR